MTLDAKTSSDLIEGKVQEVSEHTCTEAREAVEPDRKACGQKTRAD